MSWYMVQNNMLFFHSTLLTWFLEAYLNCYWVQYDCQKDCNLFLSISVNAYPVYFHLKICCSIYLLLVYYDFWQNKQKAYNTRAMRNILIIIGPIQFCWVFFWERIVIWPFAWKHDKLYVFSKRLKKSKNKDMKMAAANNYQWSYTGYSYRRLHI